MGDDLRKRGEAAIVTFSPIVGFGVLTAQHSQSPMRYPKILNVSQTTL